LTDIVATRIGAELEHFYLRAELTRAAVARERERLARDMHDGLLQDLTAANLQLRNLARVVPEPASERIKDVAQLVSMQQQHIRDFVAAVNPKATSSELQTLAPQLRAFAARVSEQWRCRIGTTVEPADLRVPGQLVTELWLMLSEAAANAVRHGRATELTMDVRSGAGALHVAFRDDGQGTMHGDGFADLVPFSMSQRVSDLGGRLGRARVSRGFGLDIQLPLAS
jgi:signal transduction histidine kinase